MTGPRDPWADPDTATEQGVPYSGPPAGPTAAYPGYGVAGYGVPGYGVPGYGAPAYGQYPGYGGPGWQPYPPGYGLPGGWPPPPAGPRRPGQVVTAAVLALVQAGVVAVASAYVLLFASVLGIDVSDGVVEGRAAGIASEAAVLAWVQFASVVALVAAGVVALNRRDRGTWLALLATLGVQVALALYWAVRIVGELADLPGPDTAVGVLVFGAVVFATGPAVGIGLLLTGAARRWFSAAPV